MRAAKAIPQVAVLFAVLFAVHDILRRLRHNGSMRDMDDLRRDMNDLRAIDDFWTAPGAGFFIVTMALLALAAIAVPALIVWWLVESGLFAWVVVLAGAIALFLWACSAVVHILCCCCR